MSGINLLFTRVAPFAAYLVVVFSLCCPGMGQGFSDPVEQQLCLQYLDILESAVAYFEPLWVQVQEGPEGLGFYDIRKDGNWRLVGGGEVVTLNIIPANGQVALAYAVLYKESPKERFGPAHLSRADLLTRINHLLRWIAKTSAYVESPIDYVEDTRADFAAGRQWHRRIGLRADTMGFPTVASALVWDELDASPRDLLSQVFLGTAARERIIRTYEGPEWGGNHDQVKQDLSATLGAAYLLPDHPQNQQFMAFVTAAGMDMVSTPRDAEDDTLVAGKPVSQWVQGYNLFSSYASNHHGHASVWYGVNILFEARSFVEILAYLTGQPVPDTYDRPGRGFDGVADYGCSLSLRNGELMHVHGPEYDSSYGAGLLAFCYLGAFRRDPGGAWLEKQAADLLQTHTSAVKQFDNHRRSWGKAALAYLWHKIHPGGPYSSATEQDAARWDRIYHYSDIESLVNRNPQSWNSVSWGSYRSAGHRVGPMAIATPANPGRPLIYAHVSSLTGVLIRHPSRAWLVALAAVSVLAAGVVVSHPLGRGGAWWGIPLLGIAFNALTGLVLFFLLEGSYDLSIPDTGRLPAVLGPGMAALAVVALLITGAASLRKDGAGRCCDVGLPLAAAMMGGTLAVLILSTDWYDLASHLRNVPSLPPFDVLAAAGATVALGMIFISQKFPAVRRGLAALGVLFAVGLLGLYAWYHGIGRENPPFRSLAYAFRGGRAMMLIKVSVALLVVACVLRVFRLRRTATVSLLGAIALLGGGLTAKPFCRPSTPLVQSYEYSICPDNFSTAAEVRQDGGLQLQAFFSFADGPLVTAVQIVPSADARLSWSGLPVFFLRRDGLTEEQIVDYAGGRGTIAEIENVITPWWAVDGKLGVAASRQLPLEGTSKVVGFNWARDETYRDKADMLGIGGFSNIRAKAHPPADPLWVSVYANLPSGAVRQAAEQMRVISDGLPEGVHAATMPHGRQGSGSVLAVVNFCNVEQAFDLKLVMPGGAPALDVEGIVEGNQLTARMTLQPFGTIAQNLQLFVACKEGESVIVRRVAPGLFRLRPANRAKTHCVLCYSGPELREAVVFSPDQTVSVPLDLAALSREGEAIAMSGDILLQLTRK